MKELINIQQHDGKNAVSARELYTFLEVSTKFNDWISRMLEYGFEKDKDFSTVVLKNENNSKGGRSTLTDYALTLDCAKEIAMIQRSAKGKQAREYFIACEKKFREVVKPLTTLDMLELSIKQLREQEEKLSAIESDIHQLKAKTQTRPDYFTIVGYATLQNMRLNLAIASKLGGKASRLCKEHGYMTDEIPDPRFGKVKMYPTVILERVFAEASL